MIGRYEQNVESVMKMRGEGSKSDNDDEKSKKKPSLQEPIYPLQEELPIS